MEVPGTNIKNSGMEVVASVADTKGTENKFGASENTKDSASKSGASENTKDFVSELGISDSNIKGTEKKPGSSDSNTNLSESKLKKAELGASESNANMEDTSEFTTHCIKKNNSFDTFKGNTLNRTEALKAMKQNSTTPREATPTAKICNECDSGCQTTVWKTYTDYTTYCPQATTVTITVCEGECIPSTKTVAAGATLTVNGKCIVPETTTIGHTSNETKETKEHPEAKGSVSRGGNPEQNVKVNDFTRQKEVKEQAHGQKESVGQKEGSKPSQPKAPELKVGDTKGADTSESGNSGTSGNEENARTSQTIGTSSISKPGVAPFVNSASKNALGAWIVGLTVLYL